MTGPAIAKAPRRAKSYNHLLMEALCGYSVARLHASPHRALRGMNTNS